MLEYGADRSIAVNHQPIPLDQLETRLRDVFESRKEKTMFIVGDPSLRYGEIVAVIDAAKGAGVEKVGIVTMGMRNEAAGTAAAGQDGRLVTDRLQIDRLRLRLREGRLPSGEPAFLHFCGRVACSR